MMAELANAGLTQEDILHKTQVLMKAFKREDPTATLAEYALASKQKNLALKQNNTSPKDFTLVCTYIFHTIFFSKFYGKVRVISWLITFPSH